MGLRNVEFITDACHTRYAKYRVNDGIAVVHGHE
jgi:hypothetical protein